MDAESQGDSPPPRGKCYRVMLFLFDLLLLCFLAPRNSKWSIRLVCLLACRGLLATLGTAASLGLYQALMLNAGRAPETTLANSVNALFGTTPEPCVRERRDTWIEVISQIDDSTFPPLTTSALKNTTVDTLPVFSTESAMINSMSTNVSVEDIFPSTENFTLEPEDTFAKDNFNMTWMENDEEDQTDICMDLFAARLTIFFILATLILLTAGNLTLNFCLCGKAARLNRKQEHLKECYAALARLSETNRVFEDIPL